MTMVSRLLTAAGGGVDKLYVDDVFSAYTYTGNGATQTITNGIQLGDIPPVNQTEYTSAGTYSWVCPVDVTTVSVVCIGGGGSGALGNNYSSGGGGGGLSYANNISVTPGNTYTVVVGAGGTATAGTGSSGGNAGGGTHFKYSTTVLCSANGGAGGSEGNGGSGGTPSTGTAGFPGGAGGVTGVQFDRTGGGGAGGYTAAGGIGTMSSVGATASTGGGGGGGNYGSGGGGVGTYGSGTDGGANGGGGSSGANGVLFSGYNGGKGGNAGGGGGGGAPYQTLVADSTVGTLRSAGVGGTGAVRIIWGQSRTYPSTLTTDQTVAATVPGGGLVWNKNRSVTQNNFLVDTKRLASNLLSSNLTNAQAFNSTIIPSFTSNGFTTGTSPSAIGNNYISWTFRKAPKFFDVVTYTGDGVAGRAITHSLGSAPGMIFIKATSTTSNWAVWHRGNGTSDPAGLSLNFTNAALFSAYGAYSGITSTTFKPDNVPDHVNSAPFNVNGATYVAYLFAHDASTDGLIKCGSYAGNGSATGPKIDLGWEPQYLMIKNASGTGNWQIMDNMRGMPVGSADASLQANSSVAESAAEYVSPTATGFQITSTSTEVNTSASTYIYMAIRRPNKPPTVGTQVYNAIARTGTGAAAEITGVGFAPDFLHTRQRSGGSHNSAFYDRLRGGGNALFTSLTDAEYKNQVQEFSKFSMDGGTVGTSSNVNASGYPHINHFFKRAPGVFDVVCYTGTGGSQTIGHNLTIKPEFLIIKGRTNTSGWFCTHKDAPGGGGGLLNTAIAFSDMTNSTQLKDGYCYLASGSNDGSAFSVLTGNTGVINVNASAVNYVAYLFATKAGISKVFSYTGNGSSLTVDCGFTTGARFVLIKRTDAVGDWYVWDTVRGLVAGNDPHLSLNTTAAEVTTKDSIDPANAGFIVNQLADTNVNVTSGTYIGLAFA